MAAPGYPQMGQMPPMGGPPMGGPPMGGPPMGMPRPMRRGTSKVVPVVVSAGLAVGVFCGLLFGLGTGKSDAAPEPAQGTNVKAKTDEAPAPTPTAATAPLKDPAPGPMIAQQGSGSAAPAAGSAAAPAQGSGSSAPAVKPPEAPKTVKLVVNIQPDAAARVAKIQIDGKDITGNSVDLPADQKSVKVSVTATGYHSADKKIDLQGGDTTLDLPLSPRATSSSPGFGGSSRPTGGTVPTRPPSGNGNGSGGKKKPSGGLIDI